MYNESYEEYIRSILGYPRMTDISGNYMMNNQENMMSDYQNQNEDLESCYPEIYRIVYPMIEKRCRENTRPITKELIDNMTNEIYMAIEGNQEVQININLGNSVGTEENRNSGNQVKREESQESSRQQKSSDNRQVGQFRNRTLNDLIRILLIRELLGRPGFPGRRPSMRPPFPGRPGMPNRPPRPPMRPPFPGGNRYPMMSDVFENNYDLYEF